MENLENGILKIKFEILGFWKIFQNGILKIKFEILEILEIYLRMVFWKLFFFIKKNGILKSYLRIKIKIK